MISPARTLTFDVFTSPKFVEASVGEPRALYPNGAAVYYGSSQIGLTTSTGTLLTSGQVFTSDVYLVAAGRATVDDTPSPAAAVGGVPAGGTTGQVLKKNSNTDGDASWASTATLSGSNPAALGGAAAPGATGQAADAGHVHDVSALASASSLLGLVPFHWYAGSYYMPWIPGTVAAGSANQMVEGRAVYIPYLVPETHTVDRIGLTVDAAASAGGVIRLGLYSDLNGAPDARIVDAGTVDPTTTGAKVATFTAVTVNRGIVWGVAVLQGGAATRPGVRNAQGGTQALLAALFGSPVSAGVPTTGNGGGWVSGDGFVTGALAATAVKQSTPSSGMLPLLALGVAS